MQYRRKLLTALLLISITLSLTVCLPAAGAARIAPGTQPEQPDAFAVSSAGMTNVSFDTESRAVNRDMPDVACGGPYGFLVVWHELTQSYEDGIFARRLNWSGTPLGGRMDLVDYSGLGGISPSVAYDEHNEVYLIVWEDISGFAENPMTMCNIMGQFVDARSGAPVGSAFSICGDAGDQHYPDVAFDSQSGNFLVVWHENTDIDLNNFSRLVRCNPVTLQAELLGGSKVPVGDDPALDEDSQSGPAVASSGTGRFLVSWTDDSDGDYNSSVFARFFDASTAEPLGASNMVLQSVPGRQHFGSAAAGGGGKLLCAWTDANEVLPPDYLYHSDIRGCVLDADSLSPAGGADLLYDDPGADRQDAAIAYNTDFPGFLIAFVNDGPAEGDAGIQFEIASLSGGPSPFNSDLTVTGTAAASGTGDRRTPRAAYDAAHKRYFTVYSAEQSVIDHFVLSDIFGVFVDQQGNRIGYDIGFTEAAGAEAEILGVTAEPQDLGPNGGACVVTVSGTFLTDGLIVAAFDGQTPTAITAATAGSESEQTAALSFPANPSTAADMVYTVRASVDGLRWSTSAATVTVAKASDQPAGSAPTVVTNAVSGTTAHSATLSGNVTGDGGAVVSQRGFVYGLSADPAAGMPGVTTVTAGSGIGSYVQTVTGLSAGTTYHVRAYAVNVVGIAYGEDRTFATPPESGGTGGGGLAGGVTGTKTCFAEVKKGAATDDLLPITVDAASQSGTVRLDAAKAQDLFEYGDGASIVMPTIPGVTGYCLELPAASLTGPETANPLAFRTPYGDVVIPRNMLSGLSQTGNNKAVIAVGQGDKDHLTDAEKTAVGERPLIQLTLTLDDAQTPWNNPAAPVTVTIPYTPTPEELINPDSLLVWYLAGSGRPVCIPNGRYDPDAGALSFTATHLSLYAVGYNPVRFKDVAEGAWYYKAVSFIAARGIAVGTGNEIFGPDSALTRGQFIVMLMRAYSLPPDTHPMENFSDGGNAYYTNYLSAARRLGIAKGLGDNKFAPEKEITRQEMFTLLYNALTVIGRLPKGQPGDALSAYSDAGDIAPWAKEAFSLFVEAGIINGIGGKLSPAETTTRAQIARVLRSLLS